MRTLVEQDIAILDDHGVFEQGPSVDRCFARIMKNLTEHHLRECTEYRRILEAVWPNFDVYGDLASLPYLPVRVFKELTLMSCSKTEVVKTLTSSGTSGQSVSKIFLDRSTARLQSRTLSRISASFLGAERVPMLVLDSPSTPAGNDLMSARGAALNGFRMNATTVAFGLDESLNPQINQIKQFLTQNEKSKFLIFGFTSIVWETCLKILEKERFCNESSNGTLLHGGGWKRLAEQMIGPEQFETKVASALGVSNTINYYGMAEQTGSIFFSCERGNFHTSIYSHIFIRDPLTLELLPFGEPGVIQLLSALPLSYPGHSILSEDIGCVEAVDDCSCGRRGIGFRVLGRLAAAEVRGCSNGPSQF